ncbi:MAG TPA: HD domain-containing phosphohydrolase [Kofleriaceae bacterium]|nr:HD domain-containing phosphohydrolase [Kofleriaceae bacterium]
MRHLGCTAWSHEAAAIAGDDHDLIRTFEGVDDARKTAVAKRAIQGLARNASTGRRVRAVASTLARPRAGQALMAAQCAQAEAFAADLGLPEATRAGLAQMYERHDGRGGPHRLRGDAIAPVARLVHAAQVIEALHRRDGRDAALAELHRRRGGQLAPAICDAAKRDTDALWSILEAPAALEPALAAEPGPRLTVPRARLADVALAFARFADLKTPHSVGHSPEVARIAAEAARLGGLAADEIERVRLAGLLHDLGSVSVPNGVWDRRGPLGAAAWEQVRLHAYHTERILTRALPTASIAALAGAHHERLDGSGYHRGGRADGLARAARILAAADAYVAMTERRAHRAPHHDPAGELAADATAGRLCRDAVALVLAAAGHARVRTALPAGLTDREAEVLGHLARGLVSKEIASALGIAPRTVKHHIEHIYEKTGVSTRAAAALFAARHDLVRT